MQSDTLESTEQRAAIDAERRRRSAQRSESSSTERERNAPGSETARNAAKAAVSSNSKVGREVDTYA